MFVSLRTVLVASVAALVFGACGSGSDPATDTTTPDQQVSPDSTEDTSTTDNGAEDTTQQDQGVPDTAPPQDNNPPQDTTPSFSANPGTPQNLSMTIGTDIRTYRLLVPADYDASVPTPVLFLLHSGTQAADPAAQPLYTHMDKVADHGVILVQPTGLGNISTGFGWLSTIDKNDSFILQLTEYLASQLNIDSERTYLMGSDDAGQYVSRATQILGNNFSGFAFFNSAKKTTPDVTLIPANKIYIGASMADDYSLNYCLNFAQALGDGGWEFGQDYAISVYPGSQGSRIPQMMRALEWLDPTAFPPMVSDQASLMTEHEVPGTGPGKRITDFAPNFFNQTLHAVGLRGVILEESLDGAETGNLASPADIQWAVVSNDESGWDQTDLFATCDGTEDGTIWAAGTIYDTTKTMIRTYVLGSDNVEKVNISLTSDSSNRKPGVKGLSCKGSEVWIGATSDVAVSVDGGSSWELKGGFVPSQNFLAGRIADIVYSSDGEGFLLALDGTVYRSSDGGKNWNEPEPDYSPDTEWALVYLANEGSVAWQGMNRMASPSPGVVVVVGAAGVVRVRSADGTWQDAVLPTTLTPTSGAEDGKNELFDVYFHSETGGCISGGNGILLVTEDAGATWNQVQTNMDHQDFSAVYCDGSTIVTAGSEGRVFSIAY